MYARIFIQRIYIYNRVALTGLEHKFRINECPVFIVKTQNTNFTV